MRFMPKWNPALAAGILILAFIVMLLAFPREGTMAAARGVLIWWDVLFPSLFPFLVLAELMLGFGVVHFCGALLDPLMRPLFRVPGIGGFVMTLGFASGYPMAAKLTSSLWEQKLINREEGERLVAFCTTSDPIFLIGAVSVGFFHDARLAVALGTAHYGSAIVLGLLMRFHGGGRMSPAPTETGKGRLIRRSLAAMHRARLQDGRPFGIMLKEAVHQAIQLVFVIGGLVVFASTVLEMLSLASVLQFIQRTTGGVLGLLGFPRDLVSSLVDGLFEVTLGAKAAGGAGAGIPLIYKASCGAFVLAWTGLSVHAQIVSLLHRTNLRYGPFFIARLLHGVMSAAAVMLLWRWLEPDRTESASAFSTLAGQALPEGWGRFWPFPASAAIAAILTGICLLLSFFCLVHIKLKNRSAKIR